MLMEHAVLNPRIGQQQPVAISLLIGQLAVDQGVALVYSTLFYQFVASEECIDDMHIGV